MAKMCKAKHPMDAAHKRCPECGAEPAPDEGEGDFGKCLQCNTPATTKFCGECGEPTTLQAGDLTAAELSTAEERLTTLAKANQDLNDDLVIGDEPVEGEIDVDETMRALSAGGEGGEFVDAIPLVKSLMESVNGLFRQNVHMGREMRAIRKEIGAHATAEVARIKHDRLSTAMVKAQIDGLGKRLETFGRTPRGPRTVQDLRVVPRTLGAERERDEEQPPDFPTIMAKCHVAHDKGQMSLADLAETETWLNNVPGGVPALKAGNPGLGAKVARALAANE